MPITYQGPHVNIVTLTFSEHDIVAMYPVDCPRTILLKTLYRLLDSNQQPI